MSKLIEFVKGIFGGKNPLGSMTAWGIAIFLGGDAFLAEACSVGIIGADVCVTLQNGSEKVGLVLATLGLRRAANK